MAIRKNTVAFCGGAYGDEGKGRIIDEYVHEFAQKGRVVVYRDNGGANAGHTVSLPSGKKIALHQLPSGIFSKQATVILGKGMVIHPGDLLTELHQARDMGVPLGTIMIDTMATLSLDTHRAFEAALKNWQSGSHGSTGRGISPAYADVLLRHPLQVRHLKKFDKVAFREHYRLYERLVAGLSDTPLAKLAVPHLGSKKLQPVGSLATFLKRCEQQATELATYCKDVHRFLSKAWADESIAFVFEKAQGIGIDVRWGVYPDVTASNTTFDGFAASSEGIINHQQIAIRAAVIKATYTSSVGSRILPTAMPEKLAHRIREDAHEYGATTLRPRDIAYIDIPALRFYAQTGHVSHHILTHMDIAYLDTPIKICTHYMKSGKPAPYRPDQQYLSTIKPVYTELPSWDGQALQNVTSVHDLPTTARDFLQFMAKNLDTKILMVTTGPQRHQGFKIHSK